MGINLLRQPEFIFPSLSFAGIASGDEVDTLIVSDVHLGTDLSRPDALLAVLKSYTFRRLILLGDIFDISSRIFAPSVTLSSWSRSSGWKAIMITCSR